MSDELYHLDSGGSPWHEMISMFYNQAKRFIVKQLYPQLKWNRRCTSGSIVHVPTSCQTNGLSCGAFVTGFAMATTTIKPFPGKKVFLEAVAQVTQSAVPQIRKDLLLDLLCSIPDAPIPSEKDIDASLGIRTQCEPDSSPPPSSEPRSLVRGRTWRRLLWCAAGGCTRGWRSSKTVGGGMKGKARSVQRA